MKVLQVYPESPLFGQVRPGYQLVAVNNQEILDSIDFCFKVSGERVKLKFTDLRGREITFSFNDILPGELGLDFDDSDIKICKNNCIFCFVRQQPKGMRRQLYVRDEDYRLSFTHGNYITLSNITGAELERIVTQRLSPLYISVHATDETLRRKMLGNKRLAELMPQIRYLAENHITLHTQVVLCPVINDGAHLEKTIDDLAGLYPRVKSLAVVPVGLTRYREKLTKLRTCTKNEANEVVTYLEKRQREFLKLHGSRFVWPADEFYVQAKRSFPKQHTYEDMAQFENGVGMAREFLTVFNHRRHRLKDIKSKKRVLFLTGYSAYDFLKDEVFPFLRVELGLNIDIQKVPNIFWGETVTVSGLLTGKDFLKAADKEKDDYDMVVLPPNCLNHDDLFLDDMSREEFQKALGKPVLVGQYNLANTIQEIYQ